MLLPHQITSLRWRVHVGSNPPDGVNVFFVASYSMSWRFSLAFSVHSKCVPVTYPLPAAPCDICCCRHQTQPQLKPSAGIAVVGSKAAFETYNSEAPEGSKLDIVDPFSQEWWRMQNLNLERFLSANPTTVCGVFDFFFVMNEIFRLMLSRDFSCSSDRYHAFWKWKCFYRVLCNVMRGDWRWRA